MNSITGKCPHCGLGKLFVNRFKMRDKCDNCDTYFIEKNGDNWFFLLFIGRAFFIFPVVVILYLQFSAWPMVIGVCLSLFLFIYATKFRLGLSLAFDYYMRSKQQQGH